VGLQIYKRVDWKGNSFPDLPVKLEGDAREDILCKSEDDGITTE